MGKGPDFSSLFNKPQSFYDWQAQQQQSDPAYIADSIARIQAEEARRQQSSGSGGSDWSPVDSSNNISWGGQTYSPAAYEGLMP